MKKNTTEKIFKSQGQACKLALKDFLFAVLVKKKPADKIVSAFFRNNKKFGSRDRRLILETSFAVFRWWGWLKKLLPKEINKQFDEKNLETLKINDKHIAKLLFEASVLDNLQKTIQKEIIQIWAKEADIKSTNKLFEKLAHNDLQTKISYLNKKNPKSIFSISDLIPAHTSDLIPSNIDKDKLIIFLQKRPPMWLRSQTKDTIKLLKRLKKLNLDAHISNTVQNAIYINHPKVNLYSLEDFKKGRFEVQDLASQAIGLACAPSPGERWWDACAGAGGKSLQLSFLMNGKGRIVASDIREYKLKDLKKRAKRAAIPNIQCSPWNGKALKPKKQNTFDGVLVDAPCSCSGTWRRNPDAKWNITPEDVEEMSKIQIKILQNAATGVKQNGTLIYATCSIFKMENQDVVNQFLKNNKNFQLEPFINPITKEKTNGIAQILPWDENCDATFIAKFRKT